MKILIAPNSFKECASSTEIAGIIKKRLIRNGIKELSAFPITDGGDGFLEVCLRKFSLKTDSFKIRNCFNNASTLKRAASDEAGKLFVIESADFIGLRNIPEEKRLPLKLNSRNLGELIYEIAKQKTPEKIIVGVGGTGTVDLGLGICVPFGLKLFDNKFNELEVVPGNYVKAEWIKLPERTDCQIEAVLDVNVPVYGKNGSVMIFAKQKGAKDSELEELDKGFRNILRLLKKDHSISLERKLLGAGGSLAVGLSLISNKFSVTTSKYFLLKKLGLLSQIKTSDIVITGEGRFDHQSYLNKAPGVIVAESLKRNKTVALIAGSVEISEGKLSKDKLITYDLSSILKTKQNALKYFEKGINTAVDNLSERIRTGRY